MVVTPVAPHFSLDRSLVLTDEQVVRVEVVPDRAGVLVIDGAGDRAAAARRDRHLHGGRRARSASCATSPRPSAASCASGCWPTGNR